MGMDEILIDERKYVSSKRAAKVTGYAKDYIGQLCREGRVPARLVGRSWYVLETAIHDHRFGKQGIEEENTLQNKAPSPGISSTWESPRYEASPNEILPPINRVRDIDPAVVAEEQNKTSQNLQDSWRAWFERVAEDAKPIGQSDRAKSEEVLRPAGRSEEEEVNVPIHAVYDQPPEELLPQRHFTTGTQVQNDAEKAETPIRKGRGNGGLVRTIRVFGVSLAVLSIVLAAIGTGYFDKYVVSSSQVSIFTGAVLYNK
jgi:hypothetical protein